MKDLQDQWASNDVKNFQVEWKSDMTAKKFQDRWTGYLKSFQDNWKSSVRG